MRRTQFWETDLGPAGKADTLVMLMGVGSCFGSSEGSRLCEVPGGSVSIPLLCMLFKSLPSVSFWCLLVGNSVNDTCINDSCR